MSSQRLRVSRSHFPVTALGPGVRLGVWVQGCPLVCTGCMARDTWDVAGGVAVDVGVLADRWHDAIRNGATGLTISGGEPLAQPEPLAAFLIAARTIAARSAGEYDILVYTGYELEELDAAQWRVVAFADALITGRYEAARPTGLIWRGSANQRLRPLTALGRLRYSAHVTTQSANPAVQARVDEAGVWLVGVPQRGMLARLDRDLRAAGMPADRVSWRRSGRTPDGA